MVQNLLFDTTPLVIHAHGPLRHKPYWEPIKTRFFASPRRRLGPVARLTILTWNNGHAAMGLLERSLDHLGVPCRVLGAGVDPWVNSVHKPRLTYEALATVETEYVLGVDSRDAIVVGDPHALVDRFERDFACDLVFSADRMNWPNVRRFRDFEDGLPGAAASEFRYLNSGAFLGRTDFCRAFFAEAARTEAAPEAPAADQGIFKALFARYHPAVQLDYRCALFQNIGFVFTPILQVT